MKAEDLEELPTSTRAILRTPEAKAAFPRLRAQGWLVPFIECDNRIYKRLGAQMLIQEIVCAVSPDAAEEHRLELLAPRRPGRRVGWRSSNGRAPCPYCSRPIAIKNDGTFRGHERFSTVPCPGSGCSADRSTIIPLGEHAAKRVSPPPPPPQFARDADVATAIARISAEHRELIAALAASDVEELAPDTVREPAPFWAFPWPAVVANANWEEDLLRAEFEDRRVTARADRAQRREERINARAERREKAARLGIFKRR